MARIKIEVRSAFSNDRSERAEWSRKTRKTVRAGICEI